MLHEYGLSYCDNELSKEAPSAGIASKRAGAGHEDGWSSSGRAGLKAWSSWRPTRAARAKPDGYLVHASWAVQEIICASGPFSGTWPRV